MNNNNLGNTNFINENSLNENNINDINFEEISYEVFQEILLNEPNLINWININVNQLKSFTKRNSRSCCF